MGWVRTGGAAACVVACLVLLVSASARPARACSPPLARYAALPLGGTVLPTGPVQLVLVGSHGPSSGDIVMAVTTGAGDPIPFSFATVRNGVLVTFDTTGVSDVEVYAPRGSSLEPLAHIASYTVSDLPLGAAPAAPHVAPGAAYCDTCSGGSESCCFRSGVLNTAVEISGDGVAAAWADASGHIAGVLPYGTAHTTSTGQQQIWYVPASTPLFSLDVLGRSSAPTVWTTAAPTACGGDIEPSSSSRGACQAGGGAQGPLAWSALFVLAIACIRRGFKPWRDPPAAPHTRPPSASAVR